jgi:hypothetical protein
MSDEPAETDELRKTQVRREGEEQELARAADEDEETAQHERRAEKARYLREKLDERAESEREESEREESEREESEREE